MAPLFAPSYPLRNAISTNFADNSLSFHRQQEGDQLVVHTMVQTRRTSQQVPFANGHAEKKPQDDYGPEKTDYSRWRLLDESGRQTWHYLTNDNEVRKWPQSVADKYHLGLPTV